MITTAAPVLTEVSHELNESSTIVTSQRVGYFNRAVKEVLSFKKWGWEKRKRTLDVDASVQEYDLSEEFSDYNPLKGIISVWVGGEKIDSIDYDAKADTDDPTGQAFYLTPDNMTIGFIKELDGTEEIEIWLYAHHTYVSTYTEELTFSIPDEIGTALSLFIQHLVHKGKRQRYDANNAIQMFKDEIDKLRPMAASKKIKDRPKTVSNIFRYNRVRRVYSNH